MCIKLSTKLISFCLAATALSFISQERFLTTLYFTYCFGVDLSYRRLAARLSTFLVFFSHKYTLREEVLVINFCFLLDLTWQFNCLN